MKNPIIEEVKNLYQIIRLTPFRKTEGVTFDYTPMNAILPIDGIDRVLHRGGAVSPGSVGTVLRPWYMHQDQTDHIIVLHGYRDIELYTPDYGNIITFRLSPESVIKNGTERIDSSCIIMWPPYVFHRIKSSDEFGSASLNFASRGPAFDLRTNFNIYDVNTETGISEVIRDGYLDQN